LAAVSSGLGDPGVDCVDEGRSQQVGVIGNEIVGKGGGATLLAAVDRPDQRVVAGVEFSDSAFLFDDCCKRTPFFPVASLAPNRLSRRFTRPEPPFPSLRSPRKASTGSG
jgi:hypothetical protein